MALGFIHIKFYKKGGRGRGGKSDKENFIPAPASVIS
jgi:hypothetical protein